MMNNKISLVIVTYNRSSLLDRSLRYFAESSFQDFDWLYIIDNNSTDNTQEVIKRYASKFSNINNIHLSKNLGGAGGFEVGCRLAYESGAVWIGMLDDDVLLDRKCYTIINKFPDLRCFIAVREDLFGNLAEYSAIKLDYVNPFRINPKVSKIAENYSSRSALPELLKVDSGSFEGFFVHRSVIEKVGFPNKEFFIFGDDTDYSLRIKRAGFQVYAARDAKAIRQLPYVPALRLDWKFYYKWRNFFTLHYLYGENVLVRCRPLFLTIGLFFFCLFRGKSEMSLKIFKDSIVLYKQLREKSQF